MLEDHLLDNCEGFLPAVDRILGAVVGEPVKEDLSSVFE